MTDPAVAILIPVLGRPQRVVPTIESVAAATPEAHRLLFLVSDTDEATIAALAAAGADHLVVAAGRGSWACKINDGYRATTEPWIFTGADDLAFHPGWFTRALAWADDRTGMIGTNDIANPRVMTGAHSTHSLFRRSYVDELGTIDGSGLVMHEGYAHQYADDEAVATAKARGVYAHAFDSIVEHLHPMVGKAADDDTYRLGRDGTQAGKRLFLQRRRLWTNPTVTAPPAPARATVVTACYGGVDVSLHGQAAQDMPVDWVCFTDEPDLAAPAPWKVIHAPARFDHPCLAAKVHKATPTVDTPDVVWIDASIEVTSRGFVRAALAARRDGVATFAHPRRQCAPGDQRVMTVNRGEVRLDELVPGVDRLISWRSPQKGIRSDRVITGSRWRPGFEFEIASRDFDGDLVVMTTDATRARVTPDHQIAARWTGSAYSAYGVYLMRRGDWWRVGKARLATTSAGNGIGGIGGRARGEQADGVWILGVYATTEEALVAENYFSANYGLPQATFVRWDSPRARVSASMLKDLHDRLAAGGSGERARKLLADLKLDVRVPFWPREPGVFSRQCKMRAVNLVNGWMEVPTVRADESVEWLPVTVSRERARLPVYSLNVEPHHAYVGDGQVVFNCIYDEAEASLGAEGQGGKYADQPLLEQVAAYRSEGHPQRGGLYACGVVAWDLANPKAAELGRAWLAECERWSWQDQLSFPVVARRLGITPGVFPVRQIERSTRLFLSNRWLKIHPHQIATPPPAPLPTAVSIVMPYTSDDEHRQAARRWVLGWYARHHPGWQLVEGACAGEWSKGAALADAVARASHDILVVADADSVVPPDTLEEAVARVAAGAAWVMPHRTVYRLSDTHTTQVYAGAEPQRRDTCRPPYAGVVGGGITVLTRDAWQTVSGIDPRFVGWGGEDMAFGWALETLCGAGVHLTAPLYHLWHKQEAKGQRRHGSPESEALAGRYRDARNKPDAMRALIAEHAAEMAVV